MQLNAPSVRLIHYYSIRIHKEKKYFPDEIFTTTIVLDKGFIAQYVAASLDSMDCFLAYGYE